VVSTIPTPMPLPVSDLIPFDFPRYVPPIIPPIAGLVFPSPDLGMPSFGGGAGRGRGREKGKRGLHWLFPGIQVVFSNPWDITRPYVQTVAKARARRYGATEALAREMRL